MKHLALYENHEVPRKEFLRIGDKIYKRTQNFVDLPQSVIASEVGGAYAKDGFPLITNNGYKVVPPLLVDEKDVQPGLSFSISSYRWAFLSRDYFNGASWDAANQKWIVVKEAGVGTHKKYVGFGEPLKIITEPFWTCESLIWMYPEPKEFEFSFP